MLRKKVEQKIESDEDTNFLVCAKIDNVFENFLHPRKKILQM